MGYSCPPVDMDIYNLVDEAYKGYICIEEEIVDHDIMIEDLELIHIGNFTFTYLRSLRDACMDVAQDNGGDFKMYCLYIVEVITHYLEYPKPWQS